MSIYQPMRRGGGGVEVVRLRLTKLPTLSKRGDEILGENELSIVCCCY
jgi:hypothetical protein